MIQVTLILIAYFLGAIPFGLILSKLFRGVDIREHGSGNIGATNVMRKFGARFALLVLLLDTGKGALIICIARHLELDSTVMLISGFMVILGHCFPVFLRFRGGKGVATAMGVLMVLPGFIMPLMIILLVFITVVYVTRYVSLGSVISAILLPPAFLIKYFSEPSDFSMAHVIFGVAVCSVLIIRHRENIKKLLSGKESKIGEKNE